jgi:RES domain-containing protein
VISWRITKRRHSGRHEILGGEGAKQGGRWNRSGLPLVYTSENSSLAILENLVQVAERNLPKSLVAVRITIPHGARITTISMRELPATWREIDNPECIAIGSNWIESREGLVLRVPSAANSLEENVLLNPLHSDIDKCEVSEPVPIVFDPRVIGLVAT